MTEDETFLDGLTDESTRRSVLKTGALATAGAGLAGLTSGGGAAQQTDDAGEDGGDENWMRGLVSVEQFRPESRFIITSPQLGWNPTINGIQDDVWSDFNTRVIRYMNSNEQVLFWPTTQAQLPSYDQQRGYVIDGEGYTGPDNTLVPEVYRMHAEYAPFGNSGYVGVRFTPVEQDEQSARLENEGFFAEEENQAAPDDFMVSLPYGDENGTESTATGTPSETESGNATGGN